MKITKIVAEYLEAHGYGGLFTEHSGSHCECYGQSLFHCNLGSNNDCKPGYSHRLPCKDCDESSDEPICTGINEYMICSTPPRREDEPCPTHYP